MSLFKKLRGKEGPLDSLLDAARHATEDAAETTSRFAEDVGRSAAQVKGDLTRELAKTGRRLRLDERVDDIASRIRADLPQGGLDGLVAKLQRELPDTDRDRYDRAFRRGWTRARTTYVGAGVIVGIVGGVVGALLLDPERGPARRRRITVQARAVGAQVAHAARTGLDQVAGKARQVAAQRRTETPEAREPSGTWVSPVTEPLIGTATVTAVVEQEPVRPPDLTQWDAIPADATNVPNAASTDAGTPVAAFSAGDGIDAAAPGQGDDAARETTDTDTAGDRGNWHRTI